MTKTACILALSFLLLPGWSRAEFTHLGPVETLDNGVVTLDVALRVGRIVSYQRKGQPNVLVANDVPPHREWHWNFWGGDRIWPTAQMLSPQIYRHNGFDPVIDGQPWELVSRTKDSLVMKSGFSPELGIRITRKIALQKDSSEVVHSILLERIEDSVFPVHIWAVTEVKKGDYFLMETDPAVAHAGWRPYKLWPGETVRPLQTVLVQNPRSLQIAPTESFKIGTFGRWVAVVNGASAFLQSVRYDAKELYLEASSLQVFSDLKTSIFEIETLSPTWFLKKGEQREWIVRWQLVEFPPEITDTKKRAAFLDTKSR